MNEHTNIFCALAAAQAEMGRVQKSSINTFFKSPSHPNGTPYADLADVVATALPALNKHGIALVHYTKVIDVARYMTTALVHGKSETRVECDVELIVSKNDMQGFKSATTYAKRIGLESVTGLAPEDDDDGNAAAKAAPKSRAVPETGEVAKGHNHGETIRETWGESVLSRAGLTTKSPHGEIASAYARQMIVDIGSYMSVRGLSGYLAGKTDIVKFLSKFPAIYQTVDEARIKQEDLLAGDAEFEKEFTPTPGWNT